MPDTNEPNSFSRPGRRGFLGTATTSIAGLALAGAMGLPEKARAGSITDSDVLNFALNLEYLEAEYYLRATTGVGLPSSDTSGTGTYGGVISTPPTTMVTFTDPLIQQFANELAQDELNHVLFLRGALGSAAVAEPQLNLGTAWNTLAQAAGIGSSFDPFSSQTNFLLGAFVFEDVGATAYLGAVAALTMPANISYAAAVGNTESYHAGGIRSFLSQMAKASPSAGIYRTTDLISNLRDKLDGPGRDDQGLLVKNLQNITPVDANSLVFTRSTTEVLRIVYGDTTAVPGLFYPVGLNGVIH